MGTVARRRQFPDGARWRRRQAVCGIPLARLHDGARKRLYASCGDGHVAIFDAASGLSETSRVSTREGARTSLFVPPLDRLFVAVPESGDQLAEIWVYAPNRSRNFGPASRLRLPPPYYSGL